MDQHLLFGLVCCALLVVFFFTHGRKNDPVSWLALVIGVAAILVICTHWNAIAQSATSRVKPEASISTPAPLHSVAPVSPAANEAMVHLTTALGDGVITVFLAVLAVLVVILAFVRRNQPRRSPIHPATRSTRSASSANRAKSSAR